MRILCALLCLSASVWAASDDNRSLGDRTRQYLADLLRIDSSNPPGNETQVAQYLKQAVEAFGISGELLGGDPKRLNFVARLRGDGKGRPLLLFAHSDVAPADRQQWTINPFGGELRGGFIYGRGATDAKNLLAAHMAVMVEIKRRNLKLSRDLILVSEADQEGGSAGIQWLIQNAWPKIDAEFALGGGGSIFEAKDGTRVFQVETLEKPLMHVLLTARGAPRGGSQGAIVRLSEAITRLSRANSEQPLRFNATTRRYFRGLSNLEDYDWLAPLWPKLESAATMQSAASQIRMRDPELDEMLRTTIKPASQKSGTNELAEAVVEVRRMPSETRDEILDRLRQIVNDSAVEISFAPGAQAVATDPSSTMTPLYSAMRRVIDRIYPHDAVVLPFMARNFTDASYLRARGMPVYGVPLFVREPGDRGARGGDERIAAKSLDEGVELLWQMVLETAGEN
ncbi:MAG TPA: M20/M25/M40 family metallo-hydrolase [Bryobacteraceae bacterium]|nr:M20/M25/M40 family metallo-hydrolase [Bryobacteraceae bacterium]